MFKNLFDLSFKRTGKEALGFYLAYFGMALVICILILIALPILYCLFNEEACIADGYNIGRQIGKVTGVFFVLVFNLCLGAGILTAKRLWSSVSAVILYVVSLSLGVIGGMILSFIAISALTTFDNNTAQSETCGIEEKRDDQN